MAASANSLQSKISLGLGVTLILIFLLHAWFMLYFMRYLVEENVITRLEHDYEALSGRLVIKDGEKPELSGGYLSPIYATPLSGHYFRVAQQEQLLLSPSLQEVDLDLNPVNKKDNRIFRINGPGDQPLLVLERPTSKNNQEFTIWVAEDVGHLEQHISSMRNLYLISIIMVLGLLLLLQRLIIRRSLNPVDLASEELRLIDQGKIEKISQTVPSEIQPLVDEINLLIASMQKRIERSRNASGNLAHALKTPLSVLRQLTQTREICSCPDLVETIEQSTESINTAIERELKKARLAGSVLPGQRFQPADEIPALVQVMEKIYANKKLQIKTSVLAAGAYQLDREDMLELIGNLFDNACKWCAYQVTMTIVESSGLSIIVEDDGPGIDSTVLEQLMKRGSRLDEQTPGHGLGLSIVREIVNEYKGKLEFSRSKELGGLSVQVWLPVNVL